MLHLLISVSKNLVVLPNGRVRRPDHVHGVSLKAARKNKAKASPIVHFFLWDAESKALYAEIGKPGDLTSLTDFFKRAIDTDHSILRLCNAHPSQGVCISNIALDAYPEVLDLCKSLGYPAYRPDVSSLKSAAANLRTWEQDLTAQFYMHLGLYETWKAFVPAASFRASGSFQNRNEKPSHPQTQSAYGHMADAARDAIRDSEEEIEWIHAMNRKMTITDVRFAKGLCDCFYKGGGLRYDYAGLDWVVTTTTGEYRLPLFGCKDNPRFVHLCGNDGVLPIEIDSRLQEWGRTASTGPTDFVGVMTLWRDASKGAPAITALIKAGYAETPIGKICFAKGSSAAREIDRMFAQGSARATRRHRPELIG
jgi:hypothetical protein